MERRQLEVTVLRTHALHHLAKGVKLRPLCPDILLIHLPGEEPNVGKEGGKEGGREGGRHRYIFVQGRRQTKKNASR